MIIPRTARLLAVSLVAGWLVVTSFAQEGNARHGDGRFAGMARVGGVITAIESGVITLQGRDGSSVTVKLTPETEFRKERQPAKLADFKTGDRVLVAGEMGKGNIITARFVAAGGMGAREAPNPERMREMGLGKRFITGEVKSIHETRLTILRPDGESQVIEVDENTSFRNQKGESVTLADIKIGDRVGGRGEVKNGVFVPTVLRVGVQPGIEAPPGSK
jgi:Domain of unknown function (DUF5666)